MQLTLNERCDQLFADLAHVCPTAFAAHSRSIKQRIMDELYDAVNEERKSCAWLAQEFHVKGFDEGSNYAEYHHKTIEQALLHKRAQLARE
jgi:hypothetical protein